jgi:lipoprotein-releasing system ATP-binding protein
MGDEPTGNLDCYNSENVFNIFKQLKEEEGLTLLVALMMKILPSEPII